MLFPTREDGDELTQVVVHEGEKTHAGADAGDDTSNDLRQVTRHGEVLGTRRLVDGAVHCASTSTIASTSAKRRVAARA